MKKVFPSCSKIRLKKYTDSTPHCRIKSVYRKNFFEGFFQPFINDLKIRFFHGTYSQRLQGHGKIRKILESFTQARELKKNQKNIPTLPRVTLGNILTHSNIEQ